MIQISSRPTSSATRIWANESASTSVGDRPSSGRHSPENTPRPISITLLARTGVRPDGPDRAHAADLHEGALPQERHAVAGAGRVGLGEAHAVDAVQGVEVALVDELDLGADHLREGAARLDQDRLDVADRLVQLGLEAADDELARPRVAADLAGHPHQAVVHAGVDVRAARLRRRVGGERGVAHEALRSRRRRAIRAASLTASARVGCGWTVRARSSRRAAVSTARAASDTRSDADGPARCTPRTTWVSASATSFTRPAVSSSVTARPLAEKRARPTTTRTPEPPRLGLGDADGPQLGIGEGEQRDELVEGAREPGDDLGGHPPLLHRLVRQGGPGGDVTDGEDGGDGRPPLPVDDEAPVGPDGQAGVGQLEVVGVGDAADGHQHPVGGEGVGGAVAGHHRHGRAVVALDPCAREDLDPVVGQAFADHGDQIGIEAGEDVVERLDDRDPAPEAGPGRPQLHADVAAAHHDEPLRDLGEGQRARRVHDAPAVDRQGGRRRRPGPGGQHGVLEAEVRHVVGRLDGDAAGVDEAGRPLHDLDPAQVLAHPADEPVDDALLPRHDGGQVHGRGGPLGAG